jgi:hypothetical protein
MLPMKRIILSIVLSLMCFSFLAVGQEKANRQVGVLNFFLECHDCDFDFVRQQLKTISFVRNPELADVHIMSTESGTGSGGRKYYLQFIGKDQFEGKIVEYNYTSEQSETDDDIREGLLKLIKTGILHFNSLAGLTQNVEINFVENETQGNTIPIQDRWNKWIFNIEAGGDFEKEETQNEYGYYVGGRIEKVTENWKTRFDLSHRLNIETFIDGVKAIKNEQQRTELSADYIKSLTKHWSAGAFTNYYSDTYLNTRNNFNAALGIEYNIYPWKLSNRKMFTFRYSLASENKQYFKETIYEKIRETLFYESVEIRLELKQPWGEIETRIEGRHFFHDFSKNSINFETDFSVRLSKQLSVYFEFEADIIHDQFYLSKDEGASLENLLLERRKLATAYEMRGGIGFRFTFGSIYNNVVNERF